MKGLIAKRPILYRGRMYKAGENLPGDDAKMVAAWLENDSAELCGEAKSADRGGQEAAQEPENAPEVSEDQGAGNEAQGGQEPPQEGGTEDGGMIAGHLDPKDLEDLKKADLERMATDMGLDTSEARTKADLIAVITAAEVYAPSFKDCVAADIHGVFLNNQEFASTHTIDGKEMDAVVDDNALLERDAARGGVHSDGIYKVRRLLYVSRDDYGGRPPSGKRLVLDGREYRVVQADDDAGMLAIEIEAIRT